MLSDILILVMWARWVYKDFQEVEKIVLSWEPYEDFLILLTENVLY